VGGGQVEPAAALEQKGRANVEDPIMAKPKTHDPDRLMTVTELADYLHMSAKSVYNITDDITAADGKIMLRSGYRFVRKTVMARVEAGLFGRGLDLDGLDQNGAPVGEPVRRKRKDKAAVEVSPT
jgi:hypothetical protein